jgi:hypothetical protein
MFLPLEAKNDPEFYLVAYLSAIGVNPRHFCPRHEGVKRGR